MQILYVKGIELSPEALNNINAWIANHRCIFTTVRHTKTAPYVTCYVIGVPDERTKKSLLSEFAYKEAMVSDIERYCPEALEVGRIMKQRYVQQQPFNPSNVEEIRIEKTRSLYRRVQRILRHMESTCSVDKVIGYLPSAAVEFSNEDLEEVVRDTIENIL